MKCAWVFVHIPLAISACSGEGPSVSPAPMQSVAPTLAGPLLPSLQEIPVVLSREPGGSRCGVGGVPRKVAWHDDVVRWTFRTDAVECKQKRIKIRAAGDEIDCQNGAVLARNVRLPLEECEREVVTGEVGSTTRLTCSVPSKARWGCYKYTIAGDVANGDPEIEIDRPRASPPPTSTPPPTPSP